MTKSLVFKSLKISVESSMMLKILCKKEENKRSEESHPFNKTFEYEMNQKAATDIEISFCRLSLYGGSSMS